jgi:hypothetical protein
MATAITVEPAYGDLEGMTEGIKETLLGSFRQLLRPLVRILLRNGVSYAEYEETAKVVFVEVAKNDFPAGSQPASVHRLALLTGLTTREVTRLNELLESGQAPSTENLNRIGRILGGWHQDPEFTGPYGLPLELDFDGREPSFKRLVDQYGDGLSAREMLNELSRIGVVNELPGSKVRVLSRSYIPQQSDSAVFQFMGVALRDLAETLDANLSEDEDEGYFERRVWTPSGIDSRDMTAFDELVNRKGMEFLETLDNWLSSRESDAENIPKNRKIKVGVGVYLFSDANRSFRED